MRNNSILISELYKVITVKLRQGDLWWMEIVTIHRMEERTPITVCDWSPLFRPVDLSLLRISVPGSLLSMAAQEVMKHYTIL